MRTPIPPRGVSHVERRHVAPHLPLPSRQIPPTRTAAPPMRRLRSRQTGCSAPPLCVTRRRRRRRPCPCRMMTKGQPTTSMTSPNRWLRALMTSPSRWLRELLWLLRQARRGPAPPPQRRRPCRWPPSCPLLCRTLGMHGRCVRARPCPGGSTRWQGRLMASWCPNAHVRPAARPPHQPQPEVCAPCARGHVNA